MAENEVKNNKNVWFIAWALIIVGALVATTQALQPKGPEFEWRRVAMDGHFSGVKPLTATNLDVALGAFPDSAYVTPSGVTYDKETPMYAEASLVL